MNLEVFFGHRENIEYLNRQAAFIAWLESEWTKAQELLVGEPPFGDFDHRQHLITNNTMCVLNTLANRLLSTYGESDSRSSADTGGYIMRDQRAVMDYTLRNDKGDLDNMWPTEGEHFTTEWESRGMTELALKNLELCNRCWKSTYEHIDVPEYLLRDAKILIRSMRRLHWECPAYLGGRLCVKTSFTP